MLHVTKLKQRPSLRTQRNRGSLARLTPVHRPKKQHNPLNVALVNVTHYLSPVSDSGMLTPVINRGGSTRCNRSTRLDVHHRDRLKKSRSYFQKSTFYHSNSAYILVPSTHTRRIFRTQIPSTWASIITQSDG